ncbi:MAG TPA: helix-turn-helix domain-containing protein, partial [Rhizobacter sp.]|nr:helix-turn-helix domain-containing protein [Rhizobacter sp.]
LRMSREDIGNLLGLRIETISRCLSRLESDWALDVRGRRIRIKDQARLRLLARGLAALEPA